MASIITATTTGGLTQSADNSGVLQLASGAGNLVTVPSVTGTMITTASSSQSIPKAALPTGSVLQVVSTTKTDTFSTTASSFTDVTGLSATITPTSSSSKILVILSISGANSSTTGSTARIARNGTGIGVATSAGSRNAGGTAEMYNVRSDSFLTYVSTVLDNPATTSSITYSGQIIAGSGGSYTTYINRSATDSDSNAYCRGASSITVMEIAA
jgi:hypothetical protein